VSWFKNPFARFFGFGNTAPLYNETNYTSREGIAKVTIGINLGPAASLTLTERYRGVRVEDGIISSLPSTNDRFASVTGIEGAHIFGHQLTFLYDTRDDLLTPVRGTYVNLSAELAQNVKQRGPNRWGFFNVDARQLIPHDSDSKVFVARLLFQTVAGARVPFYERPTLGGENTLRAFGLQRYIDDQALLVNFEERMTVLKRRVFNNDLEFQVAPSIDIGRVSSDFGDRSSRFQVNPGVGFRVMARPNVVGRLDVAYGRDGSNAFVGLDYPF
jgi:outer membrane protein assembly factor BamA